MFELDDMREAPSILIIDVCFIDSFHDKSLFPVFLPVFDCPLISHIKTRVLSLVYSRLRDELI